MKKISLLLLVFTLVGCSSLLTSKQDIHRFYVINPISNVMGNRHAAPIRLNVQKPNVVDWLDTEKIILMRTPNQIDFFAGSRWVSKSSTMIGPAITQSLIANNVATDIVYAGVQRKADYNLVTNVVAFNADYSSTAQAPVIHIKMEFRLINTTGVVKRQFTIENYVPAAQNSLTAIVDAFQVNMQGCLEQMVNEVRF
jgi:ABC-type uncharacterized transport system auxiliary subunit